MKNEINKRIALFRAEMVKRGIDAAIIPQTDPHQSEYIADHWQVRRFLSGFTGSAGSLVITKNEALLWVDSRYYLQGAQQLAGTDIILMKDGQPDVPSIFDYLANTLHKGATVGVNGMLFSALTAENIESTLSKKGIELVTDFDIIDEIWTNRDALPKSLVFVHDIKYAGEGAESKIKRILNDAKSQGADSVFISALDEIAWVLNIRCTDVKYNPVATSYLYIADKGSTLLIDTDKIDEDTLKYLSDIDVEVLPYSNVKAFISKLDPEQKVLIEKARTSVTLATLLGGRAVYGDSVVAIPKGCKNATQIAGMKAAMERDGVALVKAMKELEEIIARGEKITEMGVDKLLYKYRSSMPLFFDESFGSIVGYGAHGAIVHYEATEETDIEIEPHGLLLIDSGAQYLDGTTDITRTIAMGQPTQLEKHDFTLVMKGNIAFDMMVYPKGTRGSQLDVEARKFLWREGLSYLHGTGHGVGHFLNVHEGPQTVRLNDTPTPLMLGMITSNEPGLYRENVHGVRCENLVLTVEAMTTEFGEFYKFETLTLYPFDLKLFETEIMTDAEIDWINNYHKEVRERLSKYLNDEENAWLAEKTKTLTRH